jgi:ribonuclease P protein component
MLPPKNRLDSKKIRRIYSNGIKYRGEYGMLILEREDLSKEFKIGYMVSKKIGNAVQRNRMTRILREISQKRLKDIYGYNFLYVAFKYCNTYEILDNEFREQVNKGIKHT